MTWSLFESQKNIVERVKRAISTNKYPHAYLFVGPPGTGKEYFALSIAKVFHCKQLSSALGTQNTLEPCNTCSDCQNINGLSHPSLEYVFPIISAFNNPNAKKDDKEEAVREYKKIIEKKKANPFFQAKMDKATGILVSQVNQLIEKMQFHPTRGNKKIFIISQADLLGADSSNKLLKSLEEPPPFVMFILITSDFERVLPTIRSRCQIIRFTSIPSEQILAALRKQFPAYEEDRLKFAAHYTKGNYGKSIEILQQESTRSHEAIRNYAVSFLRYAVTTTLLPKLIATIEELTKPDFTRENRIDILYALLLFFQDAIEIPFTEVNNHFTISNLDIFETVKKFHHSFSHCDFQKATREVEKTIHSMTRHANPTLAFFNLAFELKSIFYIKK